MAAEAKIKVKVDDSQAKKELGNIKKAFGDLSKVSFPNNPFSGLVGNAKTAGSAVKSLAGSFTKLVGPAGAAAAGVAAVGVAAVAAAVGIIKLTDSVANYADETGKASQRLNLSISTYQKLQSAAAHAGASMTTMATGVRTLSRQMDAANRGNKLAQQSFNELGISIKNTDGTFRTQEEVLKDTLIALSRIEDTSKRAMIAQRLLGRSASELAPMFNEGAAAVKNYFEANESAVIVTEELYKASAKWDDELQTLKEGFKKTAAEAITPFMKVMGDLAEDMRNSNFADLINSGLSALKPVMSAVAIGFRNMFNSLDLIWGTIGKVVVEMLKMSTIGRMLQMINDNFGNLKKASDDFAAGVKMIKAIVDVLITRFHNLQTSITAALSNTTPFKVIQSAINAVGEYLQSLTGKFKLAFRAAMIMFGGDELEKKQQEAQAVYDKAASAYTSYYGKLFQKQKNGIKITQQEKNTLMDLGDTYVATAASLDGLYGQTGRTETATKQLNRANDKIKVSFKTTTDSINSQKSAIDKLADAYSKFKGVLVSVGSFLSNIKIELMPEGIEKEKAKIEKHYDDLIETAKRKKKELSETVTSLIEQKIDLKKQGKIFEWTPEQQAELEQAEKDLNGLVDVTKQLEDKKIKAVAEVDIKVTQKKTEAVNKAKVDILSILNSAVNAVSNEEFKADYKLTLTWYNKEAQIKKLEEELDEAKADLASGVVLGIDTTEAENQILMLEQIIAQLKAELENLGGEGVGGGEEGETMSTEDKLAVASEFYNQSLALAGNYLSMKQEMEHAASQKRINAIKKQYKEELKGNKYSSGKKLQLEKEMNKKLEAENKKQFEKDKKYKIGNVWMNYAQTEAGIAMSVWTSKMPLPGKIAMQIGLSAFNLANAIIQTSMIKKQSYAKGGVVDGFVGAKDMAKDNRIATVQSGEMMLNAQQQRNLFNQINNPEEKPAINLTIESFSANDDDLSKLEEKLNELQVSGRLGFMEA